MPNTDKYVKDYIAGMEKLGYLTVDQQQALALAELPRQLAGIRESFERIADGLEAFLNYRGIK